MAVTADRVIVELEAKIDRYNARVVSAERQFSRSMGRIQNDAKRTDNIVSRLGSRMGVALAGLATIGAGRALLGIADEAANLTAQLRLATSQSGNFAQAQEDVRRIAEATRSDLSATAGLYGNFMRNARELAITQGEAARATETVSKAFTVGGAGAVEMAQGVRQLTQGLQSGTLRGDEFNTIMETAPRLARLLADSLDVPVGSLREMAEAGELTSDKLVRAFTDKEFTAGIDAEFKQLPVTFDQAMTLVYNSAVVTFGEFDRGGGFSQMLSNFVTEGSAGFGDLAEAAFEAGIDIRASFEGLADAFDPLLDAARSVFSQIDVEAKSLADRLRPGLGQIDAITKYISDRNAFGVDVSTNLLGRFNEGYERSSTERRRMAFQDDFRGWAAGVRNEGAGPAPRRASGGGGGGGGARARVGRATRSPLDAEAFAREENAALIDALRLRQDAAQTAQQRAAFETEQLKLEREFALAKIAADEKYTPAQRERLAALETVTFALRGAAIIAERDREIAEEAADAAKAALDERERVFRAERESSRYEMDALNSRLDTARTRKARAAIDARLLDIAEQQERADLEALIASNGIVDAAKARRDLEEAQANRRESVNKGYASPLEGYLDDLRSNGENIEDLAEQLAVDEIERMRGGMRDAILGALGVDDPFIASALDLLIEQLIIKPLAEGLSSAATGGGSFLSGVGTFIGGLFGGRASGGHVVGGRGYRVTDGEGFMPAGSGQIIPLGRMRGLSVQGGASGSVRLTIEEAPGFAARVQAQAEGVAIDVQRRSAPMIVEAAQQATIRTISRKRMT